jgi:mannose-1-phosphate guanylyltransferase/mannose-6-phosphate isomerase
LSTPSYPKHLLKVNGESLSLLQQTYRRAKRLSDKIYVVSEVGHIQYVKEQLPELPDDAFIVEPARRGTASCIVAALAHLASRHDADEPIVSIAADHYIRDLAGFVHSFKVASAVSKAEKRLVLVGVEPSYPATGFGYIQKGDLLDEADEAKFVFNVASFKEKPPFAVAKKYYESGNYLWNCSYFMASLNTFKETMQTYAPELFESYNRLAGATPAEYEQAYLDLESDAIDYALIEKTKNLLVVPASFDWMDLGSFKDMYEAVDRDEQGNHTHGNVEIEEVENSFIQNLEDKPLAVIGLDNIVVVNTPQGILVARKDLSQKVGEVSKRFQSKSQGE